jgi:hypothetical protein
MKTVSDLLWDFDRPLILHVAGIERAGMFKIASYVEVW